MSRSHLRSGCVALLGAALAVASPRVALATDPAPSTDLGEDEVTLKNGGMLRGTVTALEPGTRVVIREAGTTSLRAIPWGEVADVQRGKFAPRPAEPGPTAPGYEGPIEIAPARRLGMVTLHIDSAEPVQLLELDGGDTRTACGTPCDRSVDGSRGQRFIVVGDDVPASQPFNFSDRMGETVLHVDPGSPGMLFGGGMMAFVGVLGVLGGTPALIYGAVSDDDTGAALPVGALALGAGAALLAGGIVLGIFGETEVELESKPTRLSTSRP